MRKLYSIIFLVFALQSFLCGQIHAYTIKNAQCLKWHSSLLAPETALFNITEPKLYPRQPQHNATTVIQISSEESMCVIENLDEMTKQELEENNDAESKKDPNNFLNERKLFNHPFADLAWPSSPQLHRKQLKK